MPRGGRPQIWVLQAHCELLGAGFAFCQELALGMLVLIGAETFLLPHGGCFFPGSVLSSRP